MPLTIIPEARSHQRSSGKIFPKIPCLEAPLNKPRREFFLVSSVLHFLGQFLLYSWRPAATQDESQDHKHQVSAHWVLHQVRQLWGLLCLICTAPFSPDTYLQSQRYIPIRDHKLWALPVSPEAWHYLGQWPAWSYQELQVLPAYLESHCHQGQLSLPTISESCCHQGLWVLSILPMSFSHQGLPGLLTLGITIWLMSSV